MYMCPCARVFAGVCVEANKKERNDEQELQGVRSEWDRKTQRGRERKREVGVQRYKSPEHNVSDEGQKRLLQLSGAQTEGAPCNGGDTARQRRYNVVSCISTVRS